MINEIDFSEDLAVKEHPLCNKKHKSPSLPLDKAFIKPLLSDKLRKFVNLKIIGFDNAYDKKCYLVNVFSRIRLYKFNHKLTDDEIIKLV